MSERLQYRHLNILSPESSAALLNGNITPQLCRRIEREVNAYCYLDKEIKDRTFGGVIFHPFPGGPEKPYYRPEGADWNPVIRAIGRIGVQADYWGHMYTSLLDKSVLPPNWRSMNTLTVYPEENGRVSAEVETRPEFLKYAARDVGDTIPRFPGYVALSNYGGDADFYGAQVPQMFPMQILTENDERLQIEREALGLSQELVVATWNSWRGIDDITGDRYEAAVQSLVQERAFPENIQSLLENALEQGERFNEASSLAVYLFNHRVPFNDEFELTAVIADKKMTELVEAEGQDNSVIRAAKLHADNLRTTYETVKAYRSDVYHYL